MAKKPGLSLTTTAGPSLPAPGPVLLQDYQLIEKLAHQDRECIPERTANAKGWGAFGRNA